MREPTGKQRFKGADGKQDRKLVFGAHEMTLDPWRKLVRPPPNQTLHHDRGRILVSRDTMPLQRPRRVNCVVMRQVQRGSFVITEFYDERDVSVHDEFQAWRTAYPNGTFLNLLTKTLANLHGVRCSHLGSGPPYFLLEDGFGSLTVKRKICGSEPELAAWAASAGVKVTSCQHCVRDNLLGNLLVDEEGWLTTLPEELPAGPAYYEGSVQRILVNRYERDPRARDVCIKHYGTTCFLCEFNFVAVYGEVMIGFIHVHHLKPLANIGTEYEVDPIEDLRPVCPNCHAVLHRREPPYSLDEVRRLLKNT